MYDNINVDLCKNFSISNRNVLINGYSREDATAKDAFVAKSRKIIRANYLFLLRT